MKTKPIFWLCLLVIVVIGNTSLQAQTGGVTLRFSANHTCAHSALDSILIENLSQGGSTKLYYPDTVATFVFTDIGIVDSQFQGLYVSQNYPNPFSETTLIDVFVPTHDQLSLSVYDLSGRQVCFINTSLDAGMHQFRFDACQKQAYLLVVNSRRHAQTRLMLQMGAGSSSQARITYEGTASGMQVKSSGSGFVFNLGDELRYTGYVTDFLGEVDYEIITDTPETDQEYLFDIANQLPQQPSEIAGETTVLGNETGLMYEVEQVHGVTYYWIVPEDWTITQGQGSHSITTDAGIESGDIIVQAENDCGIGPERNLAVGVQFLLALNASPEHGGDVTGDGQYDGGEEVVITATPNEGWQFFNWTGDIEHVDDPSSVNTTVTIPLGDVSLTANFEMIDYTLTLTADPAAGGEVLGSGTYNLQDEISISATANEGWEFVGWTGDTDHVDDPTSANTTVTMPLGDVSLVANFEMTDYTLTLVASPPAGGEVTGAGTYNFQDEISISATANEGWEFVNWTGDTGFLDSPDSETAIVTMPAQNIHLTANFVEEDPDDPDDPDGTVTDIDGNVYPTVIIGNQEWMAENLRTTRDASGNSITRYCYGDNTANCDLYGGLYTWYTVMNGQSSSSSNPSGVQGICPTGWHVPSHHEWTQLEQYICNELGNSNCATQFPYDHSTWSWRGTNEGNALKSCRQVGSPLGGDCDTSEHPRWNSHSTHYGFDEFGFSALPGGGRWWYGSFLNLGTNGPWWSSTGSSYTYAWFRYMAHDRGNVYRCDFNKTYGFSLRCVRNN